VPSIRPRIGVAGLVTDLPDDQLLRGFHPSRCAVRQLRKRSEPVELPLHQARELVRRPRLTVCRAPTHEMGSRDGTEHDGCGSRHGRERAEGGDSPSTLARQLNRSVQLDQWRSAKGSRESLEIGREGLTGPARSEMRLEQRPLELRALDIQAERELLPDPSTIARSCGTGVHQAVRRPSLSFG